MSRVGKKPISIPAGVSVSISAESVDVKGPKGQLSLPRVPEIAVRLEADTVVFERSSDNGAVRAKHGLMRALVRNMVEGVSTGYTRKLEVQGIGYRAEVKGTTLVLNLGYSHPIEFLIPSGIQIAVEKDGKIAISGTDKGVVGQIAAVIRKFRSPDRYKGKGIRFVGEHIALKEGKSG